MSEALQDYFDDLDEAKNQWLTVVDHFSIAYTTAYTNFDATLQSQADLDALKAQLAMSALLIVGGGIVTALYGGVVYSTASHAAANIALDVIAARNMKRAFDMMGLIHGSETASFILGKAYSTATATITAEALKHQSAINAQKLKAGVTLPGNLRTSLHIYIREVKSRAHAIAKRVRDDAELTEAQQASFAARMRQAPFMRPPVPSIDDGTLAPRMEFVFHLYRVLAADRFVVRDFSVNGPSASTRVIENTPIAPMPGSALYPKPFHQAERRRVGVFRPLRADGRSGRVEYTQSGERIRAAANRLAAQNGFPPLYTGATTTAETLERAHAWLLQIAPRTFNRIHRLPTHQYFGG